MRRHVQTQAAHFTRRRRRCRRQQLDQPFPRDAICGFWPIICWPISFDDSFDYVIRNAFHGGGVQFPLSVIIWLIPDLDKLLHIPKNQCQSHYLHCPSNAHAHIIHTVWRASTVFMLQHVQRYNAHFVHNHRWAGIIIIILFMPKLIKSLSSAAHPAATQDHCQPLHLEYTQIPPAVPMINHRSTRTSSKHTCKYPRANQNAHSDSDKRLAIRPHIIICWYQGLFYLGNHALCSLLVRVGRSQSDHPKCVCGYSISLSTKNVHTRCISCLSVLRRICTI